MQNLINQSISSAPTIFLCIAVLVLIFSVKRFRETGLIIAGCILALISIVCNLIFWSTQPDNKELASYLMLTNVIFSAQGVFFFYGALQLVLEKKENHNLQLNVFAQILLSIISLGFYTPYWYLKAHSKFQLNNGLLILFVLLLMPAFVMHMYQYADPSSYHATASIATDIVLALIAVIMTFNLRTHILRTNGEIEIDPILTFFFGVFYLQYKINEIESV